MTRIANNKALPIIYRPCSIHYMFRKMRFITWLTIRSLFRFSCCVALTFMTSYWFYKFVIEDEDLCLVDYIEIKKADEFALPTVSVCFRNPFLDKKLKAI